MTTLKRPQQQPDPNEAYIPVRGGINAYARSLNETTDTPIGDFYKPSKVLKSLKQVDVSGYTRYPKVANPVDLHIAVDDKGNKIITPQTLTIKLKEPNELIDYDAIKKKLVSHPKDVKAYYEGLMSSSVFLTKTVFHLLPPDNSPEFKAMASCFRAEIMVDEHGGGGYKLTKVNPKKIDRLLGLIQAQPQKTGYTLNVLYEANTDTDLSVTPRPDDQIGYFASSIPVRKVERYTLLLDLVEKCGIKPEGMTRQTLNMGGVERALTDTHAIVEHILTDALVFMLEDYASKELEKRNVVNVRNPDKHTIIGKPTLGGIMDILQNNAEKQIETILNQTKTIEELREQNGIETYLDDKTAFPIFDIQNDKKTRAKAIKYYMAMQLRALVGFDKWKKEHPNEKSVVLSDLAKYTLWAKEVESGKGLKPEHRQQLINGLDMAGHFAYKYIVGKSRYKDKNGKWQTTYERKYIYLLTRLKGDKINEKTGTIMSVDVDYDPDYLKALSYNLGVALDNLENVKTETAVVIGGYLCERFVANQTKVVEKGEPIRTTVTNLCKVGCIFDVNPTTRCKTIAKALDELEQAGVIAKWQTQVGGKNITNYDKDTLSLDIWAKNPTEVYITKNQNKALKASKEIYQREWLTALKQLHNPNKYYKTPETLAKDLEITKEQLDIYLGGEEIPDEIGEQIIALKQEWDGR